MPYVEVSGKRLLFIHIPKTGGTSIEESMKQVGPLCLVARAIPPSMRTPPEHLTWSDCRALFPDDHFSYAFALVRNPYDRLESEYRMRTLLAREGLWGAMPKFSVWLASSLAQASRDRFMLASHFRPQVEFLGSGVRVFRYENGIERALEEVARESGVRVPLVPRRHLSTQAYGERIDWKAEDIQIVNRFYRDDFRELGYETRKPGFDVRG